MTLLLVNCAPAPGLISFPSYSFKSDVARVDDTLQDTAHIGGALLTTAWLWVFVCRARGVPHDGNT